MVLPDLIGNLLTTRYGNLPDYHLSYLIDNKFGDWTGDSVGRQGGKPLGKLAGNRSAYPSRDLKDNLSNNRLAHSDPCLS